VTRIVLLAVIGVALSFAQGQQEQKPAEQKQAKPDAAKPIPAGEKSKGGKDEGIKVHGHWVLEIRNPDGSLASRKEFENSLTRPLSPASLPPHTSAPAARAQRRASQRLPA
jgi:hypothetical protein